MPSFPAPLLVIVKGVLAVATYELLLLSFTVIDVKLAV
jgi:hypothetical protein